MRWSRAFLDRRWDLRPGAAQTFRERFASAQTLDEVIASFPLSVLAPRAPIEYFYALYLG